MGTLVQWKCASIDWVPENGVNKGRLVCAGF